MRASVFFCIFPSAALLVLGAALIPLSATAQTDSAPHLDSSGNFTSEMAACAERRTPQARKLCTAEALTARTARRAGKLDNHGANFQVNALKRCDVFRADDDRAACRRRVEEAAIDGNVIDGGILRESSITVIVPADKSAAPMPDMPSMQPMPMPMPAEPQ